jgi:FK506-binding nuclear protein
VLTVSPCRRFEEVVSGEEAEVGKSAKRPRESNATEQDVPTGDKLSKKAKKKLKAENGAAVPAPAPGPDGEASKKSKKEKKAKKGDAKEGPLLGEVEESGPKQKQGDKGPMQELPNGLKIQDAKLGEGPQAKKGAKVSMRYIGKLLDGKVFDSNTKGKPVRLWAAA